MAFLGPLRRIRHLARIRAVVLGSGGAARAVVYALRSQAASVCVVARNAAKARGLAARFQADYAPLGRAPPDALGLLVNATPVGMYPQVDESPVPGEWLNGELVYDLVYNPTQTRLLKDAASEAAKPFRASRCSWDRHHASSSCGSVFPGRRTLCEPRWSKHSQSDVRFRHCLGVSSCLRVFVVSAPKQIPLRHQDT